MSNATLCTTPARDLASISIQNSTLNDKRVVFLYYLHRNSGYVAVLDEVPHKAACRRPPRGLVPWVHEAEKVLRLLESGRDRSASVIPSNDEGAIDRHDGVNWRLHATSPAEISGVDPTGPRGGHGRALNRLRAGEPRRSPVTIHASTPSSGGLPSQDVAFLACVAPSNDRARSVLATPSALPRSRRTPHRWRLVRRLGCHQKPAIRVGDVAAWGLDDRRAYDMGVHPS